MEDNSFEKSEFVINYTYTNQIFYLQVGMYLFLLISISIAFFYHGNQKVYLFVGTVVLAFVLLTLEVLEIKKNRKLLIDNGVIKLDSQALKTNEISIIISKKRNVEIVNRKKSFINAHVRFSVGNSSEFDALKIELDRFAKQNNIEILEVY